MEFVCAGSGVSFLVSEGQIYSWGKAGLTLHKSNKTQPIKIASITQKVTQIDCGTNYAAAVAEG